MNKVIIWFGCRICHRALPVRDLSRVPAKARRMECQAEGCGLPSPKPYHVRPLQQLAGLKYETRLRNRPG